LLLGLPGDGTNRDREMEPLDRHLILRHEATELFVGAVVSRVIVQLRR
jgi:hypothetical protein